MKLLITGGHGFLGSAVYQKLIDMTTIPILLRPSSSELDLRDASAVDRYFKTKKPTNVMHLAAKVGGIGANQKDPYTMWRDNLLMGVHLIDACRNTESVRKMVLVGTTCAYPKKPKTIPFIEQEIFTGYPEETNAPYGVAKRCLMVGTWACMQTRTIDIMNPVLANLYGPGDNFNLKTSHVIPAIIRRIDDAVRNDKNRIELWGTGDATRDFLYVEDAADALIDLMLNSTVSDHRPINIATGIETSIKVVSLEIARLLGYKGEIIWDRYKPDGQPRRVLNTDSIKNLIGWSAKVSFRAGLKETIDWYLTNRELIEQQESISN